VTVRRRRSSKAMAWSRPRLIREVSRAAKPVAGYRGSQRHQSTIVMLIIQLR
jgi:hypothetical protein